MNNFRLNLDQLDLLKVRKSEGHIFNIIKKYIQSIKPSF